MRGVQETGNGDGGCETMGEVVLALLTVTVMVGDTSLW